MTTNALRERAEAVRQSILDCSATDQERRYLLEEFDAMTSQRRTAASEGGAVAWQGRFFDDVRQEWGEWRPMTESEAATYAGISGWQTRPLFTHPPEVARDAGRLDDALKYAWAKHYSEGIVVSEGFIRQVIRTAVEAALRARDGERNEPALQYVRQAWDNVKLMAEHVDVIRMVTDMARYQGLSEADTAKLVAYHCAFRAEQLEKHALRLLSTHAGPFFIDTAIDRAMGDAAGPSR